MEETYAYYDYEDHTAKEYTEDFNQLYILLKNGVNSEANLDFLKDAASDDNAQAQYFLAQYFKNIEKLNSCYRYWLKCSADNGYIPAAFEALVVFAGEASYLPAMVNWRKTLAQAGDSYSCVKLATMYHNGTLVRKSEEEALLYLTKAAELQDREACKQLAKIYKEGILVNQDIAASEKYAQMAKDIKKATSGKHSYYDLGDIAGTISYVKTALEHKDSTSAKKLIALAANGNPRAAYITSYVVLGRKIGNIYQELLWKQHTGTVITDYIRKIYPHYQTLMNILEHIDKEGREGDYEDAVNKLTEIRGCLGLELLRRLADMGIESAMVAAVRLQYQEISMDNYKQYIEALEAKENKSEKIYALLGMHYLCDGKNPGKGKTYLEKGACLYGEAFYKYLNRFVIAGSPQVKYSLGCILGFGINGRQDLASATAIKDDLLTCNIEMAKKLEVFLEKIEKVVA